MSSLTDEKYNPISENQNSQSYPSSRSKESQEKIILNVTSSGKKLQKSRSMSERQDNHFQNFSRNCEDGTLYSQNGKMVYQGGYN